MTARVETAPRVCERCKRRFERRRFPSGRLEDATRFADRRFCSRACFRSASADGYRIRPPGVWEVKPPQLKSHRDPLSAPEIGARATPTKHALPRAVAALRGAPGLSVADAHPRSAEPRPVEVP